MDFIYEVLGRDFFVKMFLVPTILGGIFLSKNIIYRSKFIENRYLEFILYSGNFTV